MSWWNETFGVVQSGAQLLAAKGLAAAGYKDTADKMEEDAKKSLEEKGIVGAPVTALINKAMGNDEEADKSLKSIEDFVDSVPVAGHAKGVLHYMAGDEEHGEKCMVNATRSVAVLGVGMATAGMVGASQAGEAFDHVYTSVTGKPVTRSEDD